MVDRLHSSNTLMEGMSGVSFNSVDPSSRKRELERKIEEPCLSTGLCELWCENHVYMYTRSTFCFTIASLRSRRLAWPISVGKAATKQG